jgi:dynein heavy chain, axonemal
MVESIKWQENVSKAILSGDKNVLLESKKTYEDILDELVITVRNNLSLLKRTLVCTLLVIDVYLKDIINDFINHDVTTLDHFDYTRILKYYYEKENAVCILQQTDCHYDYSYEYLGCAPRLVMTPLTNLCYLTLSYALKFLYGGCP